MIGGAVGALILRARGVGGAGLAPPGSGLAEATEFARRMKPPRNQEVGWMVSDIGVSTEGRTVWRWDAKPENVRRHVVVVCGTHGDERAAVDLAEGFGRVDRPDDLHLTIIPSLNPDGWQRGTRENSRNVDLNRNFPWGWNRRLYSGPGPASEVETQNAISFLEAERPDLTVWVHQPLGYVAALDGCPPEYADIWSDFSGVPVRPDVVQVGGGESWTAKVLGLPSMLVEVGGDRDSPIGVSAHINALEALLIAV